MSTLMQLAQTVAIDTTSQRVVFRKFFSFRGDNDEAWQRAERFEADKETLKTQKGRKIASAVSEPLADEIADRLNEQAHREEEDRWSP